MLILRLVLVKPAGVEKSREKVKSRIQAADTFIAISNEYCEKRGRDGIKGWAPATAIRCEYHRDGERV